MTASKAHYTRVNLLRLCLIYLIYFNLFFLVLLICGAMDCAFYVIEIKKR